MTDIIDPEAGPVAGHRPDAAPPAVGGVAGSVAEPDPADAPRTSRLLPVLGLVALTVLIVRWAGWWGLFVVAGLLVSVILHEFGHYVMAKRAGMKVTEFFVGFGPKLFSFTRGETTYGLKPFPLGAYVRIIGMNDMEDVEPGDEGRTYREKSYWSRMSVVLAGPVTNLVIAFLLLLVVAMSFGQPSEKDWKVASVVPRSAAAQVGLVKGDRLISVNGQPVGNFSTTFTDTVQRHAGHAVTLVVDRGGKQVTLHPTVGWEVSGRAAADLDPLQTGDQVTSVNGVAVHDYAQTRAALAQAPKGTAKLEFLRNGYVYATTVPAPLSLPADGGRGFLGISATPRIERLGPVAAVGNSASTFWELVRGSVASLGHFFSPSGLTNYTHYVLTNKTPTATTPEGTAPAPIVAVTKGAPSPDANPADVMASPANNRLMSVIGVLRLGSQAAGAFGLSAVIGLLAMINIFLGLVNLLPLPPFDGGHAAVATYEAIRERISGHPYRADAAKLIPVTYAVLVLFGFIFLSSTYLDVLHPIQNPYGK